MIAILKTIIFLYFVTQETTIFSAVSVEQQCVCYLFKKKKYRTANIIAKITSLIFVILLYYILICY